MSPDERNLLLLLAKMVLATTSNRVDDEDLRRQIRRVEQVEDQAKDMAHLATLPDPAGMTMKQACQVISWSQIACWPDGKPLSAEQIYMLSSHGELLHVFEWFPMATVVIDAHFAITAAIEGMSRP